MSATKIKYWEADSIATLIANKAFEHLMAPHKVAVANHVRCQYNHIIKDVIGVGNIATFVKIGMLLDNGHTNVTFKCDSDKYVESIRDDLIVSPGGYSPTFIVSDLVACEEYLRLIAPLQELCGKMNGLQKELQAQLTDKSAKNAMKAWPEAAPIIANFFNIDELGKDISMTSPLEQLLAKYMPMLPAPQGV